MTPDRQIIELEDGTRIVVRRPSEEEMQRYLQKRLQLGLGKKPVDRWDDGGEELLACVESPEREEMEALLDAWPGLEQELKRAFQETAGDLLEVEVPAQTPQEWLEQVPQELRAKDPRLVVVQHDSVVLALRRLGRLEHKLWEQDTLLEQRIATLAVMGREHVVWGTPSWAMYPALAVKLGNVLLDAARAKLKGAQGK